MSQTFIHQHDATDTTGRDRREFIKAGLGVTAAFIKAPDVTRDLARLKQHLANAFG